ncbi:MAG TPA: long-chain-fatty-acid--CoA ligase, partial [Myxococcota bacterium]|nr:long-chain-fatty-acid--CoA ligase [Myxococcota bacterium]
VEVPLLVDDFLRRPAQLYPDKLAIVDGALRFTYRDFQRRVNQFSHALVRLGVKQGDRVCILSPNSHFFLESFYATSRIGAILVPLNYRLTAEDHEYILNHAGVSVVLVDHEYSAVVDGIRPRLRSVRSYVVAQDSGATPAGWLDWNELIAREPEYAPPAPPRSENDTVSINYTSGTTARPKGVMLTHRNCYINAYSLVSHLRVSHHDVELWTLPMFHCNGWGGVYALTGMGGTHVVLRAIDGAKIFELIERERVTFACMAPAVLRTVLDYPGRAKHHIRTKPRFVVAGAPPPAAFIERLEQELGWDFIQIYGLTETAPVLTVSMPDHTTRKEDWQRRSRAGVPAIGVEIAVLDGDAKPVPKDGVSVGEVCARSNVVFAGYWEQPDETAKAIHGGYFHTGDLAVWDEAGSIHIVDRKKDVIISGGENISSPDIEAALFRHPGILECAVIGVPHEKWGETPKALVVLKPGTKLSEAEVIAFAREHLAHFKCPTSVEFLDALPRTATGKLQKFLLRDKYWKGQRRVN